MCAKIAVAMSGGVDSSAAAWLLKEQGHTLLGVTLKLFQGGDGAVRDAQRAARQLDIPHCVVDAGPCFQARVMDRFAAAYEAGETPNPCVDCNRYVKFGALLDRVREQEQELVATGHYVRLERDPGTGRWLLKRAAHRSKDQSYVLWALTQDQLAHSRFPLGDMSKGEIREIAQAQGLVSARKKDSQDICFVPDGDYSAFLRQYTGKNYPAGNFVSETGEILGRHQGIVSYTVGQRRGLGVSSNHGRLYVKEICPGNNTVVLSENGSLFHRTLWADSPNWIALEGLQGPLRLRAKVRYQMEEQPCTVEQTDGNTLRVRFDEPQRAITPGQSVVFYEDDVVVGGGVIRRTEEE